MCTDVMRRVDVTGSAGDLQISAFVASFVHPKRIDTEHALALDFRTGDPSKHVAVEVDVDSARRLAEAILEALDAR